ncbi:hypothetical protein E4T50_09518 [Aureobasidium sp. EXF-12298]|nr:hypothetical protein E4T50_09518 [Aureobasidium sp. EXF-12298]KAI4766307.1 hypothetical protein E4T51_00777 [Aureobasidium sp. EXF-12344]KAI4783837.1 hypothetical protein E4T52_01311 [Aureobasidium sp. EXF-3400]
MATISSREPIGSKKSKAAQDEEWERSTWNSEYVAKVIASSSDMIKILGRIPDKNGKIFSASVHKALLCFFSPYYTAALYGSFAEAQKNTLTMHLPYDRMSDLVSWLYSGNTITAEPRELFELYAFADEKMMLAFRRSIMTRLIQFNDPGYEHLEDDAMSYVKRLPENSGLFRYLVDYWVGVWARVPSRTEMEAWDADGRIPRKFFYQALEKFASLSEDRRSENESEDHRTCLARACNYHEHPNELEWSENFDDVPFDEYYTEK